MKELNKKLSIVIPVYGCAACLDTLYKRLSAVLVGLDNRYEIILVDDCGRDFAWEKLTEIANNDVNVIAVRLSRNFGQHAAITAGLFQSTGDWVVVMDCDLQDPPEEIAQLLACAEQGFDIVYAKRKQKKHTLGRRLVAILYSKVLKIFTNVEIDVEYGSFSIISKKVTQAFLQFKDEDRHYLYILHWLGFNSTHIEYEHAARFSGKSSYSFRTLLSHALDGLFFQTTALLKWIVYIGFFVSGSGLVMASYYIYSYFAHNVTPGWTSLIVLILLMSGFIIGSLGVVGLYIGRVFNQVRERPLFVIDKVING